MTDPQKALSRMLVARKFPENTCAASRIASTLAECLILDKQDYLREEDAADVGAMVAIVVANLWEVRAKLKASRSQIQLACGELSAQEWRTVSEVLGWVAKA